MNAKQLYINEILYLYWKFQPSTMKNIILTICFCIISIVGYSQVWTEPVNISNMEGVDQLPKIVSDNESRIHCVWTNMIEYGVFTKIYYSNSDSNGLTWSEPFDISQNTSDWYVLSSITLNPTNDLYISYDVGCQNPAGSYVVVRSIVDGVLMDPDTISENMPGSRKPQLVCDIENRIWCFWYNDIDNGSIFYRILEEGTWSETFSLIPGNHFLFPCRFVCDKDGVLHCLAAYHDENQNVLHNRYVYFQIDDNSISPMEEVSPFIDGDGRDLVVDSINRPHITYRQKMMNSPTPMNDSTIYRFKHNDLWSDPELVVYDPRNQHIILGYKDSPNIFDIEKHDDGCYIVHHQKINDVWVSIIVEDIPWYSSDYSFCKFSNQIGMAYQKPEATTVYSDIYFRSADIISGITMNNEISPDEIISVKPNPFENEIEIITTNALGEDISISIFDMQGRLVFSKEIFDNSKNNVICRWNGKDMNNSNIENGYYLIRVIINKSIYTQLIQKK